MGNVFGKNKEYRILMVGLDAAGKTTIMYRLKLGEIVTTIPTIGFNVETIVTNNVSLTMWDIGMRNKSRPLMRHYFPNTQALIFVVDSNDRERMDEVKDMMDDFLKEDELREVSLAVLCNKQDVLSAMSVPEITEHLELYKINRICGIFPTCGTTGEGLADALKWLTDTLTGQMTDLSLTSTSLNTNTSLDSDTSHSVSDYLRKGWQSIRSIFVA